MPDIWFPYLGIKITHLSKTAFTVFGFRIAWYGIIIAIGVFAGLMLARRLAKKSGQNAELYVDFLIFALIFALIGARLYYVIFSWGEYKNDLLSILNFRQGGLAIYGGVIGAILTAVVFCKIKKYPLLQLMDTAMPGLILGQAIGRWGNFFNQEAFGGYTDSLFAMRLNTDTAAYTTVDLLKNAVRSGGVRYIQVHPTFLYESAWCLLILVIMLIVWKHRKFNGQVACTYMMGYGLGRMFIETLRTDQLLFWNTTAPVSVFVSGVMFIAGFVLLLVLIRRQRVAKQAVAMADISFAPEDETERSVLDTLEDDLLDDMESEEAEETEAEEDKSEKEADNKEKADKSKEEDNKPTEDDLWD